MNELVTSSLFWICLAIVLYTYIGYGMLLYVLVRWKRLIKGIINKTYSIDEDDLPKVTFMVAAYNEAAYIQDKIKNSLEFNYPKDKLYYYFVTDGSDDETPDLVEKYNCPEGINLQLFHQPERRGKIAAVNRVMPSVKTPIVVFSDANTFVNKDVILNMVQHYQNPKVGAIAGEKRIHLDNKEEASSAGEGIYWKYESTLKKWDSELYSVVGAAGELFSIRTELHEDVPRDTIVEDFYLTMRIAGRGYKVAYEPEAYAVETASASVGEELKRKIRIAAGGFQALVRLAPMLNFFKYGILTFQYISHRVLRWTLAPMALPILLITNGLLALSGNPLYIALFFGQLAFYIAAIGGYILEKRKLKVKALFVPYYFCIMNYAVYRGFLRFISGNQSVLWERAKRA